MKSPGLWLQIALGAALIGLGWGMHQLHQSALPLLEPGAYPEGAPPGFEAAMRAAPYISAALIISGMLEAALGAWLLRLSPEGRKISRLYRVNLILHLAQPPFGTLIGGLLYLEDRAQNSP